MTTWINSQFPRPDFHRQVQRHYGLQNTLSALRQDLAVQFGTNFIHAACLAVGHTWCAGCLLTPAATIHWFLIQVLNGNTALTDVSLMAGRTFTDSAFCQARTRLPLAVFRVLLRIMVKTLIPDTQADGRWFGLRPS